MVKEIGIPGSDASTVVSSTLLVFATLISHSDFLDVILIVASMLSSMYIAVLYIGPFSLCCFAMLCAITFTALA